jgi:hypothetical protein
LKIVALIQTCASHPAQWDGVTDDGRAVYVRYRWGHLWVRVGAAGDTHEFAGVRGECVIDEQRNANEYHGDMEEAELRSILAERGLLGELITDDEATRARLESRRWDDLPAALIAEVRGPHSAG